MITLEQKLKPIIVKNKSEIVGSSFKNKPVKHAEEINSGFGIVDLLFYRLEDGYLRSRKNLNPITSSDILKTLLFLKGKKTFSISYLNDKLPFTEEKIKKILLKSLLNDGLVKQIDEENYKLIINYTPGFERTLAIELKLKDWKGGLYQAYRYKWFSDISYLALYSPFSQQAKKNIHLFKEHNVGLIEIFDNESLRVIFRPKIEKPFSKNYRAIANENLLRVLT